MSPDAALDEGAAAPAIGPTRTALPVVAVGVAACAACCAPPILGAIGITVGLAGLAWLAGGLLVAAVVALAGSALIVRRRRRGAA